jgi:glucose-1-phosphate thymidylyltransferase
MKVIIPLAGFGTRLRPHTYTKPKPLINVAGKAVLGHILDKFAGMDVEEFIIVHGYLGEQIQEYIATHYPHASRRARFVEQKELVGQADAILRCRPFVSGPVFTVFVDTLFEADLSGLAHEAADAVAFVKEVDDPRRFGVAVVEPNGYVQQFVEKPDSTDNKLVVIGMYYIKNSAALMRACQELMDRNIQTKGEYFLTDALNLMIEAGAKFRTQAVDVWEDCGKPETVLHTNRYLLEHGHDNSAEHQGDGYLVIPPVNIAPTAIIKGSVIGPYATISEGCHIIGSIIRDSIIDEDAIIEEVSLEQSLIGKGAVVKSKYRRLSVGDSSSVDLS